MWRHYVFCQGACTLFKRGRLVVLAEVKCAPSRRSCTGVHSLSLSHWNPDENLTAVALKRKKVALFSTICFSASFHDPINVHRTSQVHASAVAEVHRSRAPGLPVDKILKGGAWYFWRSYRSFSLRTNLYQLACM
jgi:hypothetical protein